MSETLEKQIKYYRAVLNKITEEIEQNTNSFIPSFKTGHYSTVREAEEFANRAVIKMSEGRMQLGNSLRYISGGSPYREASIKRMCGETDHIPDPVDTDSRFAMPKFSDKVSSLDYLREVLEEMKLELINIVNDTDKNGRIEAHIEDSINKLSLAKNYLGKILFCIKQVTQDAR